MQAAVLGQRYKCFIHPDTPLPMMYMPDCLRATWELVTAPRERLSRCTYNVTAMSFTPAQLERSIRLCYPDFEVCPPRAPQTLRSRSYLPAMRMRGDAACCSVMQPPAPCALTLSPHLLNESVMCWSCGRRAICSHGHAVVVRAVCPRRVGGAVCGVRSPGRGYAQVDYEPDFRQDIAKTWPASIDDGRARADWAWRPRFDLDAMTDDMLAALLLKFQASIPEPGGCIVRPAAGPKALAAA